MMRIVSIIVVSAALAGCSRHPFERFFASGQRYLAAKKYSEAAIEFQNAVRADPQSIAAQLKLGDAYAALGRPGNAAAANERVSLAQMYLESGRAADGERQLLAALDAQPDNVAANRTYASYLVTT